MKLQLKHIKTISTAPPSIHHMKKKRGFTMTLWSCFRRNDSFRDPGSSFRAVNAGSPWWPAHRTGQVKWMAENSPWNEMVKSYGSQGKLMINLVGWLVDDGRLIFRQTLLGLESFVFKCLMFEAFSAVFQCLTDVLFLFFSPVPSELAQNWLNCRQAKDHKDYHHLSGQFLSIFTVRCYWLRSISNVSYIVHSCDLS